ncbi:MAG: patatin-like phospholipase family protein, partial [Methylocella sp.]
MIFDYGDLAVPASDATKNAELTPAPVLRSDPDLHLGVDHVLTDELVRLRPNFKPSPIKPGGPRTTEDEEVSPALARDLFGQNLTALCLSGGGIRSASFCLGILQALAKRKLLSRFDYLSTVSGGGYIGAWLSAWRSREGQSTACVEDSLVQYPEPKEVTSLRDFTSYITPKRGLMSSDTWTGLATLIRNLVLNWTLFLPLLLLLVWFPKVAVVVFAWLQNWVAPGGVAPAELGKPAICLLTAAAALYFASELFVSWQMIRAEQRPDNSEKKPGEQQQSNSDKPPPPYGAGQVWYVVCGLLPAYAAAGIGSVVLVTLPPAVTSLPASLG